MACRSDPSVQPQYKTVNYKYVHLIVHVAWDFKTNFKSRVFSESKKEKFPYKYDIGVLKYSRIIGWKAGYVIIKNRKYEYVLHMSEECTIYRKNNVQETRNITKDVSKSL